MALTDDTINAVKAAQSNAIQKADPGWTQQSGNLGLTAYDLSAPAKLLYPVLTPLRNMIARVSGSGGTATNWKAITAINVDRLPMGVSQGSRSGFIATTVEEYTAPYAGLGLEDFVNFEAEYAGEGFDDVKARSVEGLLRSFLIGEEQILLAGNRSVVLAAPVVTAAEVATGGSMTAGTYVVRCVALTPDGLARATVSAAGVKATISRTPGDGSAAQTLNGGSSAMSAASSAVNLSTPGTKSIFASVVPIPGAAAYAWYWGVAGAEKIGAITATAQVSITAAANTAYQAFDATGLSADHSTDGLIFDGILSQVAKANSGAYWKALGAGTAAAPGQGLTSDGAGGIVQIDDALRAFWDKSRLSPDLIMVSAQELKNLTACLASTGTSPGFAFGINQGGSPGVKDLTLTGGTVIGAYLNKFTMSGGALVQIMLHPNMPAGTMLFYSRSLPYSLSGVQNVLQVKTRRDYYQLEWPLRTRRYEYGVYSDQLLQNFFPPAFGIITNIADKISTTA